GPRGLKSRTVAPSASRAPAVSPFRVRPCLVPVRPASAALERRRERNVSAPRRPVTGTVSAPCYPARDWPARGYAARRRSPARAWRTRAYGVHESEPFVSRGWRCNMVMNQVQSATELAQQVAASPALQQQIKENPVATIASLAAPLQTDVWIYRVVVCA